MKQKTGFCLFVILLCCCQQSNATTPGKYAINSISITCAPDTGSIPDYGDLNVFWTDFKKYALAKNVKKLAELTAFKFMNQNNMISKEEFLQDFSFSQSIKGLRKAAPPKYTRDKHYDYDTQKYLGHIYTATVGGILLLFCKIKGKWKFTGVNYGE